MTRLIPDKASKPEPCGHTTTIGSYPGDRIVSCDLPKDHKDLEHEAKVWWLHGWPQCDQAEPTDD